MTLTGYLYDTYRASERRNKERILELATPLAGARLLDLGCNDGTFTVELARTIGAAESHGVEFVAPLAAEAAARGVQVASHDLNGRLPYDDDSFDVVHSNQVIEHLEKTDVFVKEIRRVLRTTGYAIVSTNNLASWHNVFSLLLGMQPTPCHVSDELVVGNRFDPKRGREHPEKGFTHLRVFAFEGLKELLELHGLAVEKLVTSGYYPFPPRAADVLCRLDRRHGAFLIARVRRR
ncbi:MAG TPA: methyltransferase domain-containing protein [Gaiellaceae bacterium]